jgi:hypothetical protein
MMFTSSAQGSTPGVPGAHTASLAPEQADSISEIFADGLGNGSKGPKRTAQSSRRLSPHPAPSSVQGPGRAARTKVVRSLDEATPGVEGPARGVRPAKRLTPFLLNGKKFRAGDRSESSGSQEEAANELRASSLSAGRTRPGDALRQPMASARMGGARMRRRRPEERRRSDGSGRWGRTPSDTGRLTRPPAAPRTRSSVDTTRLHSFGADSHRCPMSRKSH